MSDIAKPGEEISQKIKADTIVVKGGNVEITGFGQSGMGCVVKVDGIPIRGLRRVLLSLDYENVTELTVTSIVMPAIRKETL